MSETETKQTTQTLGEFLKSIREKSNLSLKEAQDSTKITLVILKAIESDDFSSMPAEAFCRGFYVMYAKFLKLDHEEILSRYLEARNLPPAASQVYTTPPVKKGAEFRNYAEPSPISPLMSSIFAFFILLGIIIGGCLYFQWNPIDYLNSKLDSIQTSSQPESISTELPAAVEIIPAPTLELEPEVLSEVAAAEQLNEHTVDESIVAQEEAVIAEGITTPAAYHLEITFHNNGTLTVTLDNGFLIDKQFQEDQTLQWEVNESIVLNMPEFVEATILMNGIEIPLPDTKDGRRLLSLPEDLLN